MLHTLTSQRKLGQTVEPLFFAADRPKLWECIFIHIWSGKKWTWLSIGGAQKPFSLKDRLCQNSCKINRLWKSRQLHVCPAKNDHMAVFAHCANSSGDGQVNYRRLHDQQLTLGQFVLLPMQTWKGNTFKTLQMSTMFVSHPIKMKVCSNHFWQALAGWRSIDSQFFCCQLPAIEYQESWGKPHSLSYLPELLECDSVILSIEVLKDWHLIQCSQAVSAANSTIAKIDAAVDPSKGCKGP